MKKMEEVKVKDAMTEKVVTVSPEDSVMEAGEMMKRNNVGSLIIEERGKPLGIITSTDLVKKIISRDIKPSKVKIKDVMIHGLNAVSPEETLTEATRKMVSLNVKRLGVMKGEKLVGFLSYKDVIKISPQLIEILIEKLSQKENEPVPKKERERKTISGICEKCGNYSENLKKRNGLWVCEECIEEV